MALENIPDKITDKIPTIEEYRKSPNTAISYVVMILFFMYFVFQQFVKEDDCGNRIATLEKVIIQKDDMINKLNNRVSALEVALDVRTGVIKQVVEQTDSISASIGGVR